MNISPPNEYRILARAAGLIERWTGIAVPDYRWESLADELRLGGQGELQSGLHRLEQGDADLRVRIVNNVAIGETYFFRHFGHFEALREFAAARAREGRGCNVLSAGCSTGEEAWSAAAVLAGVFAPTNSDFRVTGWDLCAQRIAAARSRTYRQWSVRQGLFGMDRFFREKNGHWTVDAGLDAHVKFQTMNLVTDAPAADERYDVIFFRNVSIYWKPAVVGEVIRRLCGLLTEGGRLMLGPSDPVDPPAGDFVTRSGGGVRYFVKQKPEVRVQPVPHPTPFVPTPVAPLPAPSLLDSPSAGIEPVRRLADQGRYDEALTLLPSLGLASAEALLWEGILELSRNEAPTAVKVFRQCVFLQPEEPALRFWLASALEAEGQRIEAARERRNATGLSLRYE